MSELAKCNTITERTTKNIGIDQQHQHTVNNLLVWFRVRLKPIAEIRRIVGRSFWARIVFPRILFSVKSVIWCRTLSFRSVFTVLCQPLERLCVFVTVAERNYSAAFILLLFCQDNPERMLNLCFEWSKHAERTWEYTFAVALIAHSQK